jgi:para-nitrobenzyl esterase
VETGEDLGIPDGPGQTAALRRVSAARLAAAPAPAPRSLPLMFVQPPQPSYQPVVDGYVLPAEPWKLLHRGDWAHVPLLIGSNADECDMWLSGLQQPRADNVAYASRQRVRWFAGPRWPRLASVFSPQTLGGLLPSTSRMMTALEFNAPSRYAARCAERTGAKAFLYYFTRRPPGCAAGADHGAEVPYVFGRVAARAQKGVDDATDINLSLTMMRYWATFAATGDPNTRDSPTWAANRPATDRVLRLDTTAKMIPVPYPWVCRVAERVDREH